MKKVTYAAFAAAFASSLSSLAAAQSAPIAGPPGPATQGTAVVPIEGEIVLVEPANLGVGKSRTVVLAGTEELREQFRTVAPAVARKRWQQGSGARNFLIERGEFERMQKVAHRWELAALAMGAVDAAQTIATVSYGDAKEFNPLLGRKPSAGKVIAYTLLRGGLHYSLFRYANARNPNTARKAAILSFAIQSGFVGFGMIMAH